ncbi:hypothetical protein MH928_17325 [Flavobacterium sp. WW92]|uniref:hypothetical protein n=1 Tax=unclassified Flavobacterium TaxID=196869 RepID=UPI002225A2DE|nr:MULTISPECIES: hypothetical protein [unclassified Flavobacterium]WDO13070.1 hypothetical protein MH928_17325 [Flavobacterium sp. WW92]
MNTRTIYSILLSENLELPELDNDDLNIIVPKMVLQELKTGNPKVVDCYASEQYGDINSADYIDPIEQDETIIEIVASFKVGFERREFPRNEKLILQKVIAQFENSKAFLDIVWSVKGGRYTRQHILFENMPVDIC